MISKKLVLYTDGASRGNPGPAAIGVVIRSEKGQTLGAISEPIGVCTNNQAEYRAVIAGLEKALETGATHIALYSDSELVVRQLGGDYRVKNELLKPLFARVSELRKGLASFEAHYIPREKNREADALANAALDGKDDLGKAGISGINTRKATKVDYPALLAILAEIEKQHVDAVPRVFRHLSRRERINGFDSIFADPDSVLLLAETDGEVLGYIHMALKEIENSMVLRPRRYIKIHDLAVGKKHHRSGAGSALMQAVERWAKEEGVDTIELNVWEFNIGALAFYQELGYTTSMRHMWKRV
jgi:ribonuclease HI